ncbi:MAG: hypothetical protein EOO45_00295 [Flavobacterium sp.]|nr:MAG: hypothetical protein EOO45_00295 [Flavobacterium sp.]
MNSNFIKPALVFLFIFSLINEKTYGQGAQDINMPKLTVAPSSPNAASFARYGESPVGLFTGVPEISVPLYELKLKQISIPIALSYHGGGLRVNDMASNVGLGWSLQAGGAITCSINGLSDIENGGWLQTASQSTNFFNNESSWINQPGLYENEWDFMLLNSSVNNRVTDTQPDMFHLSMPGKSIKFFFDRSGAVVTVPYDPIKIEFLGIGLGFMVTDEKDIKYEFKAMDVTNTNNEINTTYLLSKINTTNSEQIIFNYNSYGSTTFWSQPTETRYYSLESSQFCTKQNVSSAVYTTGQDTRLESIVGSNGETVNFLYNFDRLDLPGAKALTNIMVSHSSSVNVLYSYSLAYGHYLSIGATQPQDNYRLKLLSVTEAGKHPQSFHYDEQLLPCRLSYSQDHWGYYNAKSNTTLLPADPSNNFPFGADREPVEHAMGAGMLKKTVYPTGGSSVFEYEGNRAIKSKVEDKIALVTAIAQDDAIVSRPFVVTDGSTSFKAFFKLTSGDQPNSETGIPANCRARILDSQGNVINYFFGLSNINGDPYSTLTPGQYTLELETSGSFSGTFKLEWWYKQFESNEVLGGGVRIKSIAHYSCNETGLSKTQRFEYKKTDGTTSGINNFEIYYTYNIVHKVPTPDYNNSDVYACQYKAQTSSIPLISVKGSPVFYSDVNVFDDQKSGRGFRSNKFSPSTSNSSKANFPFAPLYSHDWIAGLPIETIDYKYVESSGLYTPVKKVTNEYNTVLGYDNPSQHQRSVMGFNSVQTQEPLLFNSHIFKSEFFSMVSSWPYLKKSTETVYDAADSLKKAVSVNSFFYDNAAHGQLTRQEITKSSGEKYSITFRYPKDLHSGYAFVSSPVVEKRIMLNDGSTDRLIAAEITTYNTGGGIFPNAYYQLKNSSSLPPASVGLFDGNTVDLSNYDKRIDYGYDLSNNLVLETKNSYSKISYLYSYNSRYPIALIQNASYVSIEDILTPSGIQTFCSLSNPDKASIDAFLAPLKSSLPNAFITSYTYKPLVGMTSMTDTKGITTYYHYDAFGRLEFVKDQDGNVIKQNIYHYNN